MSKKKKKIQLNEDGDLLYEEYDEDEDYDVGYHEEVKLDFEKVKSSFLGMDDWTGGIPASQVNAALRKKKNEEEHEKVMRVFHMILYTICFSGIIMCSAEYGNVRFQTMEFYYARMALIFFVAVLWGLQKVKLFRWQSLLVTIPYIPYCIFYYTNQAVAPDISMAVVTELIVRWMILMLLIDMILKKNLRQNNRFIPAAFALFCVMSVFTLMNRSGSMVPMVYLYFIIMCFIPVNIREWEKVQEAMFYGGFIAFVTITVFSFTGDPFVKVPRDYFMITDDLGQVFGLSMALSAFGLLYFKEKHGRLSATYFLSAFWLIASIVMACYKGTDGIILGVVFLFFFFFVFGIGSKKWNHILIRLGVVLALITAVVVLLIIGANKIVQPDFDTAAFSDSVMNSPLKNFPETAEELIGKAESAHMGSGAYREIIKPGTVGAVFNVFLDSRVAMFFEAFPGISWDGHPITGEAGAFVLAAKVQYLQYLYQFGYFAGGLNLIVFIGLWVVSVIKYIKTRKMWYLMPMLLFAMTFGAWFNVSSGLFYSLVFFSVLSLYPLLVEIRPLKKKKKKKTEEAETENAKAEEKTDAEKDAGEKAVDEKAVDEKTDEGKADDGKNGTDDGDTGSKADGENDAEKTSQEAENGTEDNTGNENTSGDEIKPENASGDANPESESVAGGVEYIDPSNTSEIFYDDFEGEDEDDGTLDNGLDMKQTGAADDSAGAKDSGEAVKENTEIDSIHDTVSDSSSDEEPDDSDTEDDDEDEPDDSDTDDDDEDEPDDFDIEGDDDEDEPDDSDTEEDDEEDDDEDEAEAEDVHSGFVPLATAEIRIGDPEPVVRPRKKKFEVVDGRPIDREALADVEIVDLVPIHPNTEKNVDTDKSDLPVENTKPAETDKPVGKDSPQRREHADRHGAPERHDGQRRGDRPDRPERRAGHDRPERHAGPDRSERHAGHDRPERHAGHDRPKRHTGHDRPGKTGKGNHPDKGGNKRK